MKLLTVLIGICLSLSALGKDLEFKLNNKSVVKLSERKFNSGTIEFNDIEVGSVDKTLHNAWRGYERTYRGYSLYEVLDAVYGKDWKTAKKITFVALDGYRQDAVISDMLDAGKDKSAYISYTETGKKGFSKFKKGKKSVDPGPFYIVWSNFSEKDKAKHSDDLKWPYQLKTINLTK